jgi:hypothetical protein
MGQAERLGEHNVGLMQWVTGNRYEGKIARHDDSF